MKLLIDTTNEDLFVSIIEKNKTRTFAHLVKYKKKSDILPVVFKKLIDEVGITANDIIEIYVVNGPGSFMGIRAGMTFAKTMALVTGAKLHGINNMLFISGNKDGKFYVDAKGGKSYEGIVENSKVFVSIVDFEENSVIDYKELIDNPTTYLEMFDEVENIIEYEANYVKKPQIGGL